MRTVRPVVALALALAGGGLVGCEKPVPTVTVFSGTSSVRAEALCGTSELSVIQPAECAVDALDSNESLDRLSVKSGNTVGISVDPAIAEKGWSVRIGTQALNANPISSTYFRFSWPETQMPENGYPLQIVSSSDAGLNGLWAVRLVLAQ